MNHRRNTELEGVVLDTEILFSFDEFCHACAATRSFVLELVEEGVIEPMTDDDHWRFHGESLVRARRALCLVRDLGVNVAGAALALDLLDQLERLEARVRAGGARR